MISISPRQAAVVGLLAGLVAASQAAPLVSDRIQIAPSASSPQNAPSPMAAKLAAGYAALSKREHSQAHRLFKDAADANPQSPEPLLALAEAARVINDSAQVKQWLDQALKVAPKDAATLYAWGQWHLARQEFDQAEKFWNAAILANPQMTAPLIELGNLNLTVRNKLDTAIDFFQRALSINPKLGGAHYALGVALQNKGQTAPALAEFNEAARLSPNNPLPLQAAGRLHAAQGNPDAALSAFNAALKAQAGYYPAQLDKAGVLQSKGQLDAALAELRAVAKAQPKVAEVPLRTGMVLQQMGRNNDAFAAYQTALRLDANQAFALNNLAWLASERSDVSDRGLKWAQQAVALNSTEPRFQGTLAWVHHKRGESVQAISQLEALVRGAGKAVPESHYLLGLVLADRGNFPAAAVAWREALRLNPQFSQAPDAIARLNKLPPN